MQDRLRRQDKRRKFHWLSPSDPAYPVFTLLKSYMTALIIDTSAATGYVALAKTGQIVRSTTLPQGRELSKLLFASIVDTLSEEKIEFIAIGTGPGSFTGTRVGVTTAQALAYGWVIPLVPFASSLLPDLPLIAKTTHLLFLQDDIPAITLEYFSKTP